MKEFDTLVKSLSETMKSLGKIAEAMAEKLEKSAEVATEIKTDEKKRSVERKPVQKPIGKVTVKKTAKKPKEGATIVASVLRMIETNPGLDFKSLREKTGFDDKQLRNTVARLKKQGKITAEGRGVYHPA